MVECSDLFIRMDVSKDRHAVAVADGRRDGDGRAPQPRYAGKCAPLSSSRGRACRCQTGARRYNVQPSFVPVVVDDLASADAVEIEVDGVIVRLSMFGGAAVAAFGA